MARKPRIEFDGALYHVISRGNQRQKIFRTKEDYSRYLELLARYKEKYSFSLYAYVLMSNHVHLLIETRHVPLSKILQGIQQSYTIYFNRKHHTVGHLFQGRYKAILCDKDAYLLSLVKYIHLNPVRARVSGKPEEYPWSSHRIYMQNPADSSLLDAGFVLGVFSRKRGQALKQYRAFMRDGMALDKEEIYRTVDQRLLGDEDFVERVKSCSTSEIRSTKRSRQYTLADISRSAESLSGVSLAAMQSKSKSRDASLGRRIFCHAAKAFSYRNQEIAGFLKKDPASVTRYLASEGEMKEELDKIMALLKP
jgi:putative transposase